MEFDEKKQTADHIEENAVNNLCGLLMINTTLTELNMPDKETVGWLFTGVVLTLFVYRII